MWVSCGWILENAGLHSSKYHAPRILFIDGLILSPDLALIYIQKKQLCLRKINESWLVYKLYDLTPEEIKIVEEFNERKLDGFKRCTYCF